ncbi:MAG: hypothetical protein II155_07080, partial [Clostridia bacterium]|nr:hypothetical protein [Clostridia bacterium]
YTWNGEPVWLLEDVLETTNNSFSGYNSAPVIAGENAIPIIKGYSTTWGANYTADFGNSSSYVPDYDNDTVVVPMGEVVEMTLEDLDGGGWLITSGVTFFSTFEVKVEIENATTLQNSNYQIVMNIIKQVIPEPEITPIEVVNASEAGQKFTIEGYVTSNASGYDQSTAFFDCIYVQDDTAGINLFPVAGNFHIGQYVRVTGVLGAYNGERELVVSDIREVEGHEERVIEPELLTAQEAMSPEYTGSLIKTEGRVESLGYSSDGALETIMVRDDTGLARVFIDGYIMSDYVIDVKVGDRVSAIGLASITVDTEDPDGGFIPRMRVRNRSEVVVLESGEPVAPTVAGEKAELRERDTADGKSDIRFIFKVTFNDSCVNYKGELVGPTTEYYEITAINAVITLGNNQANMIGKNIYSMGTDSFTYTALLSNIPERVYDREITAEPSISYVLDGETATVTGTAIWASVNSLNGAD